MRTVTGRDRTVLPEPWQAGHGSSILLPVPWQSGHGSEKPKCPWLRVTKALPLHVGQVRGLVPGLAPLP